MAGGRQVVKLCWLIVGVLLLAVGCGDDDSGSAGSTTSSSTASSSTTSSSTTSSTTATPGSVDESEDDSEDEGDPDAEVTPLVDVAAGTLDGFPIGASAEAVSASLLGRLGPAQYDSGWAPTECPPSDNARMMTWGDGLRVYFGDDGEERLDGWAFALTGSPQWADSAVLPDGVAWGDHIDDVAAHQGAVAEYSDAFSWWEARIDDSEGSRSFIAEAGDALNRVVVGYEPRCT